MSKASVRGSRRLRVESLEQRELLAGDLRVVELGYHPHPAMVQFGERDADANDFEFVEVMNTGDTALNLNGYQLSRGVTFRFGPQILQPGDRRVITKDLRDFRSRYGNDVPIAIGNDNDGGDNGEYQGSLNNAGEQIVLRSPSGQIVQSFHYFDSGEWPSLADGRGASLEVIDADADFNDPKNWRAAAEYGGTPGTSGRAEPSEVVINELLTHTDLPQIDAVELVNRSNQPINLDGWYLSDSFSDIFRYKFAGSQATLGPGEYLVLDENELGFSFRGQEADDVLLIEPDAVGRPLRFVDVVSFSATQNGVSLGRWEDRVGQLFPMRELTFEAPNSGPLIGDVIISEINYHPSTNDARSLTADEREFIELFNRTGAPLDISQWRLRDAVDFTMPNNTVIGAGATLILVGFNPNTDLDRTTQFRETYGIGPRVPLLGPYTDHDDPNPDQLDDDGERLIWERPEDLRQLGLGYVLVDRVTYDDAGQWPLAADGAGRSLVRENPTAYGDLGSTWIAASPSPGRFGVTGDLNDDGIVDHLDLDSLCAAISLGGSNPVYDMNGSGHVDTDDFDYVITTILDTSLGDANLDGRFDSSDLVQVFAAGQYEDDTPGNSSWRTGDWNCDGKFTTSDLVAAFQSGGYVA